MDASVTQPTLLPCTLSNASSTSLLDTASKYLLLEQRQLSVQKPTINTVINTLNSSGLPTPVSPARHLSLSNVDIISSSLSASGVAATSNVLPAERAFHCEHHGCLKTFSQMAHLRIHQRSHTGERPFLCDFLECNKSFTQLGNLRTHQRKHTGERPFKCSFPGCTKDFSQMGNMQTHAMLHLGVKPYQCGIENCGRSFSQLGNLKSHQKKVHYAPAALVAAGISPPAKRRRAAKKVAAREDTFAQPSEGEEGENLDDDELSSNKRVKRSPSGLTKEQRLLMKMKAVLDRSGGTNEIGDSSEEED